MKGSFLWFWNATGKEKADVNQKAVWGMGWLLLSQHGDGAKNPGLCPSSHTSPHWHLVCGAQALSTA